jgi:hypothetical protein
MIKKEEKKPMNVIMSTGEFYPAPPRRMVVRHSENGNGNGNGKRPIWRCTCGLTRHRVGHRWVCDSADTGIPCPDELEHRAKELGRKAGALS